jgi:hypothetical protein
MCKRHGRRTARKQVVDERKNEKISQSSNAGSKLDRNMDTVIYTVIRQVIILIRADSKLSS